NGACDVLGARVALRVFRFRIGDRAVFRSCRDKLLFQRIAVSFQLLDLIVRWHYKEKVKSDETQKRQERNAESTKLHRSPHPAVNFSGTVSRNDLDLLGLLDNECFLFP